MSKGQKSRMGFFGWKFRGKSEDELLKHIRAVKREVKKSHRVKNHIFKRVWRK